LKKTFAVLQRLPGINISDRTGFAYTMGEQHEASVGQDPPLYLLAHTVLGICLPLKEGLYRYFSLRKILVMLNHPNHLTSQQSADPDADQRPIHDRNWGGGIRFAHEGLIFLLAVSGLPWKCDEAVGVVTAYQMNWITAAQVSEYAELSDNEVIAPLFNACK
jgi:hypothetical protein